MRSRFSRMFISANLVVHLPRTGLGPRVIDFSFRLRNIRWILFQRSATNVWLFTMLAHSPWTGRWRIQRRNMKRITFSWIFVIFLEFFFLFFFFFWVKMKIHLKLRGKTSSVKCQYRRWWISLIMLRFGIFTRSISICCIVTIALRTAHSMSWLSKQLFDERNNHNNDNKRFFAEEKCAFDVRHEMKTLFRSLFVF